MKHTIKIDRKPIYSGKESMPDGAITGNGDLAVILGNCEEGMRIYLSKIDLIYAVEKHSKGGLRPLGCIDIPVAAEDYENYRVETDLDNAVINCKFGKTEISVTVPATENSVILSVKNAGEPKLGFFEGQVDGEKGEYDSENAHFIYRSFADDDCAYETHGYAGLKKVGEGLYYLFTATNHNTENPKTEVENRLASADEKHIDELKAAHGEFWRNFRAKSEFSCADADLELGWYASLFYIAVSRGSGDYAPGLYANFITVEYPNWKSDYHLNYNYQAPFYGIFTANHPELSDCYMAPLEAFMPRGREFAKRFGAEGILLPVGIAPKGLCTEIQEKKYGFERLFLGQKNNAIHPADIAVLRWNATHDLEFAEKHAYPYIKEALRFFETYATFENGRYSICNDACHEVPMYRDDYTPEKYPYTFDKNNVLTLGLLRLTLPAAIEMAKALGVDEDRQLKWQDMLDKLSPFPTTIRFGRRVYRYTEHGQRWHGDNDVGLQHLYPCNGLDYMDKRGEKIARNSFDERRRYCYCDGNAVSSYFPMAARLKVKPSTIIKKLKELDEKTMMSNMLFRMGGGGLEYSSVHCSTVNEMLLQSFRKGRIDIYPDWDKNTDVKFENFLATGAVLVSSEMKNGVAVRTTLKFTKDIKGKLTVSLPEGKYEISGAEATAGTDGKRNTISLCDIKAGTEIHLKFKN